jgi:uncharacterized protein YqjF (DUF2071 family)
MHQRWDDVVFAHWPVAPEAVAALLPGGLRPDVFDGTAWVSLVPFWMRDLRLRALPPIPTTREFAEVNVRTYVQGPDGPGVWFCSLDATHALPVVTARAAYGLPYFRARVDCHVTAERDGPIVDWAVRRRGTDAPGRLTVLARSEPIDDPLAVFLTARWRLYTGRRRVWTAMVEHDPWPLLAGEPLDWDPGLVDAAGLRVDGTPLVHWSPGVDVTVGRPHRAGRHRG